MESGYTAWAVTVGEQPTTAFWNILGANDASFNNGNGINNNAILWRHLETDIVPSGTIQMYGGASAPSTAWLLCQGQAISRTVYAALFLVLGTTYGTGDGSTTFNLPNLQGKVPVGLNTSDGNFQTLGQTGGEDAHSLSQGELPYYQLGVGDPGHSHTTFTNDVIYLVGSSTVSLYATADGGHTNQVSWGQTTWGNSASGTGIAVYSNGGNQAHNNLQPYLTVNYIIKT